MRQMLWRRPGAMVTQPVWRSRPITALPCGGEHLRRRSAAYRSGRAGWWVRQPGLRASVPAWRHPARCSVLPPVDSRGRTSSSRVGGGV